MRLPRVLAGTVAFAAVAATPGLAQETTLTIATVNNSDMIRMQELAGDFTEKNPDIQLEWVTLEENVLRQRVTTDIATQGGQYDVMTIGNYEVPIWAENEWLAPLDDMPEDYDADDIIEPIREALSYEDQLYAAPFYAESVMTLYRTDLFETHGIEMPDQPTWSGLRDAAKTISENEDGTYGICLRGKPGWGENMALIDSMGLAYGEPIFGPDWTPKFDSEGWQQAVDMYIELQTQYGAPGAASNGFNENLALFASGKCAIWVDSTVAASFVSDPEQSQVVDTVGFAPAPCGIENCPNGGATWLWSWNLAIPASSEQQEAAQTFIAWATSKAYTELVANERGWVAAPPGTRTSLYENEQYLEAAPFAEVTLNAIEAAKAAPTDQKPYYGLQFAAIPEFQGLGTSLGQQFAAAITGQMNAQQVLQAAQQSATREMTRAGYIQ